MVSPPIPRPSPECGLEWGEDGVVEVVLVSLDDISNDYMEVLITHLSVAVHCSKLFDTDHQCQGIFNSSNYDILAEFLPNGKSYIHI